MEIDIQQARQELREALAGEAGEKLNQALGLGGLLTEQLQDLKLGELLDNPPPGADEVVAIAKVEMKRKGCQRQLFDGHGKSSFGVNCISLFFWACIEMMEE